jgi:hypothetical protein
MRPREVIVMKKIACLSLVIVMALAMPAFGGEYRVRLEQPFKGSPDPQVSNWYFIVDLSGRRIGYMTPCSPDQGIWDIRIDDDIDWNAFPELPPKAPGAPNSDAER